MQGPGEARQEAVLLGDAVRRLALRRRTLRPRRIPVARRARPHDGLLVRRLDAEAHHHRHVELLAQLERQFRELVALLAVGGFEHRHAAHAAEVAVVLLGHAAAHAGVAGDADDEAAVDARIHGADERVGGHAGAGALHRGERSDASHGGAEGDLIGDLLIRRPLGVDAVVAGKTGDDLRAGRAGVRGGDVHARLPGPPGDRFVAEHQVRFHAVPPPMWSGGPRYAGCVRPRKRRGVESREMDSTARAPASSCGPVDCARHSPRLGGTPMTDYRLRASALDEEGCAAVHDATITLLEQTGVEVQHDEALALLQKAGARLEGTRVRMPRQLVDDALFSAPRSIPLASRVDADGITLEAGRVYYGTGSDCLYSLGPEPRDRRPVLLADVEEMAALQEKLPSIDFVMSMAHPHELDAAFAPVAQFAAMLRGTSKPLIMVPEAGTDIALFKEMAAVCGAADSWAVYAMPTPPLVHGLHSAERLVRCAEQDVPMVYASAYLQGATAPASRAGCLLLTNAEMLSGLVISELAKPGAPFVYGVTQGAMNARTAHILYCAPESMAAQQASADLAAWYGLPTFGYGGCSDSLMLDEQWAFEAGMTLLAAALSGVTLLHDLGYVASGTASSYESVVIMDELVRWVKAYLEGVTVDETTLAAAEIAEVGPGGTHLARKYTRRHVRDYLQPDLVSQDQYDAWAVAGSTSLLDRATDRSRALRDSERAYAPATEALRELDALVERAREGVA